MGRTRKSSARVTLVLVGMAAVAGCSREPETKRDVYASKEDCLADWANKPEDCTPATDRPRHSGGGFFFYGPSYPMSGWRGNAWTGSGARSGSHAVGSTAPAHSSSISRGGFGSSGHSASG